MRNLEIKYNSQDDDGLGNIFPSLMAKHGENEIKHRIEEEYPCVVGLHTGHEVFDSELSFMQRMQLPVEQPYACFLADRVLIWNCFPPANFNVKADAEIMYSDILEWKKL